MTDTAIKILAKYGISADLVNTDKIPLSGENLNLEPTVNHAMSTPILLTLPCGVKIYIQSSEWLNIVITEKA